MRHSQDSEISSLTNQSGIINIHFINICLNRSNKEPDVEHFLHLSTAVLWLSSVQQTRIHVILTPRVLRDNKAETSLSRRVYWFNGNQLGFSYSRKDLDIPCK